ncbi:MAG TPA: hypothetical protein VMZ06_09475 [Candidatus Bathyarchaeia archaeon]|nr:hypothetical protein [Candidatus Bathyarchaeia archaeon]
MKQPLDFFNSPTVTVYLPVHFSVLEYFWRASATASHVTSNRTPFLTAPWKRRPRRFIFRAATPAMPGINTPHQSF